jgi:predicted O-methyltransferase YrrM/RimJ/RimL family protein N-acetyltransferase
MTQALWSAVDRYIDDQLLAEDPVLEAALAASDAAGLPRASIAPNQGKLLELLVRIHGARNILEVGTLGAYSTIWLARGLPADGHVVTLELDSHRAAVARANIAHAGLAEIVRLREGPALQTLAELLAERAGPFDLIFLDADKRSNPDYLEGALKLAQHGTLIIADNVVRGGVILEPEGSDPQLGKGGVQGLRRFYELLAAEPRVSATVIQTVGAKGHDGFALALVTGEGGAARGGIAPPPGSFHLALGEGRSLRYLEEADTPELHALVVANRAHLERWMPWAAAQTLQDTASFIRRTRAQLANRDGFQTAVLEDGRIVGVVGFHAISTQHRLASIGYWLAAPAQGRGTMTRAVQALVDLALGTWQLNRIEIRAAVENVRSRAIARRLGFSEEGILRDAERIGERYVDQAVYALLARDWRRRGRRVTLDEGSGSPLTRAAGHP